MNKPKIESPLGNMTYARSAGSKVLTVDDPTDLEYSYEEQKLKELEQLRKNKKESLHKAPEGAKQRLDYLLGISRLGEDVEVDNVVFSIRSLKAKETQEVIESVVSAQVNAVQAFEMRAHTMARSIYKIDGQDLGLVIGSNDIEDKVNFVKELDESLLNYLYERYTKMLQLNNKKFGDLGKDEQEAVENIKK